MKLKLIVLFLALTLECQVWARTSPKIVGEDLLSNANYRKEAVNVTPPVDGSVVVIADDLMEVDADASIGYIRIYSGTQLVATFEGCNLMVCDYDVSSITTGYYDVFVHTALGNFTKKNIYIH